MVVLPDARTNLAHILWKTPNADGPHHDRARKRTRCDQTEMGVRRQGLGGPGVDWPVRQDRRLRSAFNGQLGKQLERNACIRRTRLEEADRKRHYRSLGIRATRGCGQGDRYRTDQRRTHHGVFERLGQKVPNVSGQIHLSSCRPDVIPRDGNRTGCQDAGQNAAEYQQRTQSGKSG